MLRPCGVDRLAQLTVCISDLRIDVTLPHPRASHVDPGINGLLPPRGLGEAARGR